MESWRQELVESHLKIVYAIARQVHRNTPGGAIEIDDLISYGTIGLHTAASKYDPQMGTRFSTFAWYRVKGAMYDGMKTNSNWKFMRSPIMKAEEGATEYLSQSFPGAQVPHSSGKGAMGALASALSGIATAWMYSLDTTDSTNADTESPTIEETAHYALLSPKLREGLNTLSASERKVMEAFYYEDKSLADISEELGHSRSWGCRIHARALNKLKKRLL